MVSPCFHPSPYTATDIATVEILGHTGIRCDWALPITGPILRPLGLALEIEDHDLHHRYGRSGRNYSKGSLIWDRLFGTAAPRLESADAL